jgi:hypothetical protein
MKFGGLSNQGIGLMAVAGSNIDPSQLPSHSNLAFHRNPELASAAIHAVGRARLVSYVERGILPPQNLRDHHVHCDVRDDHCIHLILYRGNYFLGSIRCQFHNKTPYAECPIPLFREMMLRSGVSEGELYHVTSLMEAGNDNSSFYMETSGWLSNPDVKRSPSIAMTLPAAVWGLATAFEEFYGISTLRASNRAAVMLNQMGGESIYHNGSEIKFNDPYYRGPVQLMRMHSHRYDPTIRPAVQGCAEMIAASGIITVS